MIALSSGARVWLATGHTDMRKGYQSLALLVQETLKRDPHGGHLFVFRGRRGDCLANDSNSLGCRLSDGRAVVGVALDGSALLLGREVSAGTLISPR